jgi:hypothetical protein
MRITATIILFILNIWRSQSITCQIVDKSQEVTEAKDCFPAYQFVIQ